MIALLLVLAAIFEWWLLAILVTALGWIDGLCLWFALLLLSAIVWSRKK